MGSSSLCCNVPEKAEAIGNAGQTHSTSIQAAPGSTAWAWRAAAAYNTEYASNLKSPQELYYNQPSLLFTYFQKRPQTVLPVLHSLRLQTPVCLLQRWQKPWSSSQTNLYPYKDMPCKPLFLPTACTVIYSEGTGRVKQEMVFSTKMILPSVWSFFRHTSCSL